MATIFQKNNSTGFANCAILSSQENYYAPFLSQIGNWTQLRVSAYLSYCGSGGGNAPSIQESLSVSSPNLGWYWGIGNFFNGGGVLTPITSGCNFAGASTYSLGATVISTQANGGGMVISNAVGANPISALVTNNLLVQSSQFSLFNFPVFTPTGNTGIFNYCTPLTLIFTIFNQGLTGQQIGIAPSFDSSGANPNYSSFTDVGNLRLSAMNLTNSGTMRVLNYTTGLTTTGGPLPIPDTIFFRSPLNNNLLRIHNLLVEKYA